MIKIIIDTNAILRWLLNDDPKQADQVESLLRQAREGEVELIIPEIIIFELHFALEKYYHFAKVDIFDKLKSLLLVDYLQVESQETLITALTTYQNTNLSFVDCFLIAKTKLKNGKLFTFDKDLKKLTNI